MGSFGRKTRKRSFTEEPPSKRRAWKKRARWDASKQQLNSDHCARSQTKPLGPVESACVHPLSAVEVLTAPADILQKLKSHLAEILKDRTFSPLQQPPTNSLMIDQFVRPFTLQAVRDLLSRTGTITHFWMDVIKTHCYVTYSSVGEAEATRDALNNLRWPPKSERLLKAEFVDENEVKVRCEGNPQASQYPPRIFMKTHTIPQIYLPLKEQVNAKMEASRRPSGLEKIFMNTDAVPQIYLPLKEEQVNAKLEASRRPSSPENILMNTDAVPQIYLPLKEEQVNAKLEASRRPSGLEKIIMNTDAVPQIHHFPVSEEQVNAKQEASRRPSSLERIFIKTRAIPQIYFLPLSEEQVDAKLESSRHHFSFDRIFMKTHTIPQIYYLPLSEEQVNAKLEAAHLKNVDGFGGR